jgi:hypothetical protein
MKYRNAKLILLNASPIGDHVLLLDTADRFYKSDSIETVMFIKHNFKFLRDLSLGYPFVKCIDFNKISGKLLFIFYFFRSVFYKTYLLYFLPIPYKKYLIYIGDVFNYFTRTTVVSLSYKGMEKYIPSGLHIKASINDKYFYEQNNEILKTLGYKEIDSIPEFRFLKDETVKTRYNINGKYIVIHPTPSHADRRIENEKWQKVFDYAKDKDYTVVFTGIKKDEEYIDELANSLPKTSFIKVIDAKAQDLVNIFYFAEELFMVHTGPTHIAAALHKKMKVFCHLWLKQFDMSYNKNADIEILSVVKDEASLNNNFI